MFCAWNYVYKCINNFVCASYEFYCMYACMLACMYVCTYICMYVYIRSYIRTYIRMYVCMYVHTYVLMYVCMHVYMYACMYTEYNLMVGHWPFSDQYTTSADQNGHYLANSIKYFL